MTDSGVTQSTFNVRIVTLRFFFSMTCGREDMKRYMQFRTQPRSQFKDALEESGFPSLLVGHNIIRFQNTGSWPSDTFPSAICR